MKHVHLKPVNSEFEIIEIMHIDAIAFKEIGILNNVYGFEKLM